jgi:Carboxypeptidase regulatory-like domain/TonB-dependent Receptor Plug Domain
MNKIRLNHLLCTAAALFFLILGGSTYGQDTNSGAISGVVADPTGAMVPQATVTVTNQSTNVSVRVTTGDNGFYSAESIPAGRYTVTVEKPGFKESITKDLQIDPGMRRANNVTLQIGSTSVGITVTADAVQVNTETSESSGTITAEQIDNLLLNGRNFLSLASMVPGVINLNGADALSTGGVSTNTPLIINGGSQEYQAYTVDGIGLNIGSLGDVDIQPTVDGIAEMRVVKDSYSAKYGYTGSGQVMTETKSGTNTYHGTVWDFLRNNDFDANNYFSTTSPALHQNIFGYTFGGPVIIPGLFNTHRDRKTFFFASNQWQLISDGQTVTGAVFPQPIRNGDFSADPTLSGPLSLDAHSQSLLASEGKTNCITGPTTVNTSCFDPVAVALMNAYWPLPNNPAGGFNNYINEGPLTTDQANWQYRLDHAIDNKDTLTVRYLYQEVKKGFPNAGNNPAPTQTEKYYTTGLNLLVRLSTTFTPNIVNALSLAEAYDKPRLYATGTLPAGVTIQQALPDDPLRRIPNISISNGWAGMGISQLPVTASDGEGVAGDDLTWVKGHHVLGMGALYIFGIKRQTGNGIPQGSFSFSGNHTGDAAADYLLGLDSTYSQGSVQEIGNSHFRQGEAYFQDDWQARPRLSLNLGVRWVYYSADTMSGDEVTAFRPALYSAAEAPVVNVDGSLVLNGSNVPLDSSGQPANLLNGLVFAGQNGIPSGFFIPTKKDFGPRVGFNYDLSGNGTTTIRGGYGLGFSRRPLQQIFNAWGSNPPYNPSANILNSLLSNGTAGGTAAAPTTQSLQQDDATFVPARISTYSLTLEHQFAPSTVANLAYIGSQGRHLGSGVDENQPLRVTSPSVPGCLLPGQAASSQYDYDPCINTGAASPDYTRPYQGYSSMSDHGTDYGTSNYNALQAGLVYKVRGSQVNVAYTWSKVLADCGSYDEDDGSSFGCSAQDIHNFKAEYGPPNYDFTHDFTASWVYPIPFNPRANEAAKLAISGWTFSGIFLFQSGFAISPWDDNGDSGLDDRPDQVHTPTRIGKVTQFFNTAAFVEPGNGFFGDASNGTLRGPSQTAVNTSLYKTFPIADRLSMQFRVDAFNVLNKANFSQVDAGLGDGAYGQITTAHDPRIMEFAIKLVY